MGKLLLPEQQDTLTTSLGFVLAIDLLQNAIRKITHPEGIPWRNHEVEILIEARKKFPGIEIWRKWTVKYGSSKGASAELETWACKKDLPELFPDLIDAKETSTIIEGDDYINIIG